MVGGRYRSKQANTRFLNTSSDRNITGTNIEKRYRKEIAEKKKRDQTIKSGS